MPDSEIWYGGHRLLLHENPDGTFSPGVYGGAGGAAALVPTAVKTTNYTAVVKDFVPVDTTSGAVTVTLPTAPADGSLIGIKLVILGAGNSVTIARGGSDVFNKAGGATSLTLSRLNQSVLLQYKATGAIWYVTTADNSLAIGTDVQAFDADLAAIAALNSAADQFPYSTGAQTWALASSTAAGRAWMAAADIAAQRALIGPIYYAGTSAELTAALAALPATGGVIQLGVGALTYVSGGFSCNAKTNVTVRGAGGRTAGADANTVIKFNDTGSGTLVDFGDAVGCGLEDLELLATSAAFTGTIIKHQSATLQSNGCWMKNVMVATNTKSHLQTAILLDLNQSINFRAERCFFLGGGVGVRGRASNAAGDFANIASFVNCAWAKSALAGVRNVGEGWSFLGCTSQGTIDSTDALADGKWIDHDSGVLAKGLDIGGCAVYDITTNNAGTWIKFGGDGLSIHGCKISGRNTNQQTFVAIDENGSDAIDIHGNHLDQIYRGLDFGSTTGHLTGAFYANSHPGNPAGWKLVDGTTIPKGVMLIDTGATQGRESAFFWDDSATATALQFDGDTLARIYRNGAGTLYSPATTVEVAGDFYAGFGQTAGIRLRGVAGGTVTGIVPQSTNATSEMWIDGKGASADVGGVRVGANSANGGAFNVVRSMSMTGIISPTQLLANTDNWAPTSIASAYLVRVNVDAARNITGIVAPTNNLTGQILWLYNTTAFTITLIHDATSTAANRFFCPNKANYALLQGASVQLIYSATDSRWIVLAGGA